MRKDIVCITCDRIHEEKCAIFDEDRYNPRRICYKNLETFKLEEIGRLWMKSKDKILKSLLSKIDELERARVRVFRIPESWLSIDEGDAITQAERFDFTRYKK